MRRHLLALASISVLSAFLPQASGVAGASSWAVALSAGSGGHTHAQAAPPAPAGMTATCTSFAQTTVLVSWSAVTHATTYTIYQSTTSSTTAFSSAAAGVVGTSWTSPSLSTGTYWFKVAAYEGNFWASATSAASAQRTIAALLCN
jgi:hypothetical protein